MSAKHTPAPWAIESDGWVSSFLTHKAVCLINSGGVDNFEGDEMADAKLISAAPDLLEALERLVNCYSSSHSPDTRQSCWNQAKSAIKKAKGES